ncbi:MAG: hypothetical protein WCT19_03790 [Candidatus Paceibacterota bacterium]|jgi:hypothetical protein
MSNDLDNFNKYRDWCIDNVSTRYFDVAVNDRVQQMREEQDRKERRRQRQQKIQLSKQTGNKVST